MTTKPRKHMEIFGSLEEEEAFFRKPRKPQEKPIQEAVKPVEEHIPAKSEPPRPIQPLKKKQAPVVALRIPEADLTLARKQAEKKGLPCQTYIKYSCTKLSPRAKKATQDRSQREVLSNYVSF